MTPPEERALFSSNTEFSTSRVLCEKILKTPPVRAVLFLKVELETRMMELPEAFMGSPFGVFVPSKTVLIISASPRIKRRKLLPWNALNPRIKQSLKRMSEPVE